MTVTNAAYQVSGFAYQGNGQLAYQGAFTVDGDSATPGRRLHRDFVRLLRDRYRDREEPRRDEKAPLPPTLPAFDAERYARQGRMLAQAIEKATAQSQAARAAIAAIEADQRAQDAAKRAYALLLAQQHLTLMAIREAVLREEQEVLDIAFVSLVVATSVQ